MIQRNPFLEKLPPSYLFVEVANQVAAFRKKNPSAQLISLAVGDTTLPLPGIVAEAMEKKAAGLGTPQGYEGYGLEEGILPLRQKIAEIFYKNTLSAQDIFISDGAACDIGRLQHLLGPGRKVAIPDPSYPAYVDTSWAGGCKKIVLLPLHPHNNFFPDLTPAKGCDVLFFSSPNNPTGAAASREELTHLVNFCKQEQILLIFDAAYNLYHEDSTLYTLYEIPGATEVAIEIGSFSKLLGFTGVRLGWTAVPPTLTYKSGYKISADWRRIVTTYFNGASNIAQAGGLAALTPEGIEGMHERIQTYKKNAQMLKVALQQKGFQVYGGTTAPFLWISIPGTQTSWELFHLFLEKYHLITIPGSGFGPSGEGFLRLSALGLRNSLGEAIQRLEAI